VESEKNAMQAYQDFFIKNPSGTGEGSPRYLVFLISGWVKEFHPNQRFCLGFLGEQVLHWVYKKGSFRSSRDLTARVILHTLLKRYRTIIRFPCFRVFISTNVPLDKGKPCIVRDTGLFVVEIRHITTAFTTTNITFTGILP
jgi:hypothetical protein